MSDHSAHFQALVRDVAACVRCSRMCASARIFGASSGKTSAPIMFIGEAPGRLGADDTCIPFHGDRAGENFERLLSQVGLTRYDCFITNAVLCNPKDDRGNNATPNRQEIANCAAFLERQIAIINPKIVVTLGAVALNALAHVEPHSLVISKDVRKAVKWRGRLLIPLYHPGQRAMVHRSFLNQLSDYRFVAEQLNKITTRPKAASRTRSATKADAAGVVREILSAAGELTYFQLHKLFYLVEYHAVRKFGQRLTKSYVVRQKDGPYFTDLHVSNLKKALPDLEIMTTKSGELKLRLASGLFPDLQAGELPQFIRGITEKYRGRTNEQLKSAVYMTAPMRAILKREKYSAELHYNSPIDLNAKVSA